ncbi:OmpA family protein [Mycobacterium hubeiense]|uniref:channel-forming protein ArfA/OmpATb n=1 Tax=Mycobacterium hubeiense TaxID=1867256 RepID=UPI001E480B63|nr:OmpA family protein [Mycobacterium sp. QGD 101]
MTLPTVDPNVTMTAPNIDAPDVNLPNLSFAPLSILRNGNNFTLNGDIPDINFKNGLLDRLRGLFGPDINLTDNLNIKAGVNAPDIGGLEGLFKAAVDVPDFNFDLNGDTVTLTGNAPSEEVKANIEAAAKAAWPNINVVNNIQVGAPGAPPAPPAPQAPGAPGAPGAPAPGGACATLQADITGLLRTPITFATDGFTLTPPSQQLLTQIADKVKACPDARLEVVGHTDNTGNDAINIPLSNNRAKSVADYLVSQGIAGDRVTSRGVGAAEPIASNDTPDGRAQNRRVVITVVS